MAAKRKFRPSPALRILLPTLVIAALGAGAMYLGTPPQSVGRGAPSAPAEMALISTGAQHGTATRHLDPSASTTATPTPTESDIPSPVVTAVAALVSDCPLVNGFTVTVTSGELSCEQITAVADSYTQAVLGNQLARELRWSDNGWHCLRNFDSTGIIANSHGLICTSDSGTFTLVYE